MVNRNSLDANIGSISVNITVGSIITEKADVIVNSCPSDMRLDTRPGLSKVMYDAAGNGLKTEIDKNYPNGIKVGDLAVLENFVTKCLVEANKYSVKSIVFPALGTGFLKFPPKTAASNVIKAIRDFQTNNAQSSVKTVKIVIFGGTNDWTSIEQAYVLELNSTGQGATASAAPAPQTIPGRGTRAYLAHRYQEEPTPPPYWTHFKSNQTIKDWNTSQKGSHCKVTSVDTKTYQSIAKAFKSTGGSTIVKIERIENILLYEKYIQECQRTFRKAYVTQLCTPLQNVKKSSGPGLTVKYLDQEMTKHLHEEINELYLFHGTKVNAVDVIIQQGLDSRLASSGLLGTGVYTAETASKSAGYTDQNKNGESKMFLMRVCLGDIFITTQMTKFRRPPCMKCYDETCIKHPELFDSVVAEFGSRREFVVYDRVKCYPEYIITYK
ncbi:poly [ADP-ribose] polymerase 10/14/15 [Mytilus galloprovincialis]|uniref:Poly [ADP-ribose] polymerase n=1 Tax=Mytilus galloprovincialis TaxID=29158 RepID=A0A8B6E2Z1_MYTGA|nr:poly [ADP-ribose] polymerase 10/14/15 [Mytilus galloprovincialis]